MAVALAAAVALCAGLWVRHQAQLGEIRRLRDEAASAEADFTRIVAEKEGLEAELGSIEAQEMELNAQIDDANRSAAQKRGWIAEMEDYRSREAAASEEAWRLEQETASIEAAFPAP